MQAKRREAALTPVRAEADGAHSMATTGRPQPAMPGKHLRTSIVEPRKVTATHRRTIAHPRLGIRGRAVRATPPRDPIHRRAGTLLHRPAGAFPARGRSQLPVPQEEAPPVDIRAPLEGGIPEAEDTGGSLQRSSPAFLGATRPVTPLQASQARVEFLRPSVVIKRIWSPRLQAGVHPPLQDPSRGPGGSRRKMRCDAHPGLVAWRQGCLLSPVRGWQ